MPFPSKGCNTCKARRIKCDETRPVCLRCTKSKRVCEETGDGRGLAVFHVENQYASGQNKRPRGPRSTVGSRQIGHPQPPLAPSSAELNSLAVAYYVHCHLQSPSDNPELLKSLLHCVLPRWNLNAQYRMLELAVSSKALATFSRTQNYPPAAVEASSQYRRLLCAAYETINQLSKDNIDLCLLAIFFMSRYEGVVYSSSQSPLSFLSTLQSFAHHDGAFTILKIWKHRFSHIQRPSDVVKLTRRGLVRSAILRTLEIPHWMLEGESFGECGLDLEFDCILVQITNIRHRLHAILADQRVHPAANTMSASIQALCKDAQETDETLQQWAEGLPTLWPFTQHTLSASGAWSPQEYFYSSEIYSYSSPSFAGAWANYYATRMLVLSTWITILEANKLSAEKIVKECQHTMEQMANNLASSLPFCLKRFNYAEADETVKAQDYVRLNKSKEIEPHLATLMVWPLSLATSLEHVDINQRTWFKSVLAQLGHIIGIGMLTYADTDRWPTF